MGRIAKTSQGPRMRIWGVLIPMINDSPLIGQGLRAAQNATGYYAHNTYLDLIVDTGFIGLLLFFLPIIPAYLMLPNTRKNNNIAYVTKPWIQMLIMLSMFLVFFSCGTHPFYWFVFSMIILSSRLKETLHEQPATC